MQEIRILGIKVHATSMEGAVGEIARFIAEKGPHTVVTLGTEMVMAAQRDPTFEKVLHDAALVVPDAVGVVWAARRSGVDISKVAGVDLVATLVDESRTRGWRIFFLGAAEGVAEEAAQNLQKRFPGFQPVGMHNGYFTDDGPVVDAIAQARADILFLALGSPKQELWYWRHQEKLGVPVGMGVGGSFDIYAGRAQRAPAWMIRFGLEWFYRLLRQPSRYRRMLALPAFVVAVLTQPRSRKSPE